MSPGHIAVSWRLTDLFMKATDGLLLGASVASWSSVVGRLSTVHRRAYLGN